MNLRKKKDPFTLPGWSEEGSSKDANYELKYLRLENEKLREQVEFLNSKTNKKIDKNMEKDIAALLDVSMKMKYLLEEARANTMMPMELGRAIDKVIKEIENYG